MPVLIKTIDEIVQERRRDTYWVRFANPFFTDRDALRLVKDDQLGWFDEQGLEYKTAAPKGWLEGDPGCFTVYFDGPDDTRLHAYCTKYEQPSGGSLQPGLYQMYIVPFQASSG